MINHARTLLLNRKSTYFDGIDSSEYIPPAFQPVVLSTGLKTIKNILIPSGLDKFGENYLAASIMKILHAPDIESYVNALDTRVTYLNKGESLSKMTDTPVAMTFSADSTCDVTPKYVVDGSKMPTALALAGEHNWSLTPTDANHVLVKHNRGPEQIVVATNGTQRGANIELLGDYLSAYFDMPTTFLTGSFSVTYAISVAVAYNIGERQELLKQYLGRPGGLDIVFKPVVGYETELEELRRAWLDSTEVTIRFAAATLGYIYQCEGLTFNR
jgi:hypothetical protein